MSVSMDEELQGEGLGAGEGEEDTIGVQQYKDSIIQKAEHLVLIKFPEKVVQLTKLMDVYANSSSDQYANKKVSIPTLDSSVKCHQCHDSTNVKTGDIGTNTDTVLVPSNESILVLISNVKPLVKSLMDDHKLLKMWIALMVPKIEDGNNFGVSIQKQALNVIETAINEGESFNNHFSKYFCGRAKLVSKEYEGGRNEEGQRNGAGRTILPNGDYYEGQYRKDLRHGLGLYIFMKSGARYTGQYFNGQKQGIGTFYYPDGSIYEGEWKADKKHGYGIYMYTNGDIYEGQWYEGIKEGIGYYKYKDVPTKFLGTWKNGVMEGPGQRITKQYRYHGSWKNNLPFGPGCFTFNNESMLHGAYTHKEVEGDKKKVTEDIPPDEKRTSIKDDQRKYTAIWKAKEVTKFLPERLPPEPRPFEYPETPDQTIADSDTERKDLEEPAYQHEIYKDIAKFNEIYIDEKKFTDVDSWEHEVFDCDAEKAKLAAQDECAALAVNVEDKVPAGGSEENELEEKSEEEHPVDEEYHFTGDEGGGGDR